MKGEQWGMSGYGVEVVLPPLLGGSHSSVQTSPRDSGTAAAQILGMHQGPI